MADITHIFGGEYSPPAGPALSQALPPEWQLREAIEDAGITPPEEIRLDGRLHRFRSGTKGKGGAGDKSGWYVGYSDGIPAGRFGCWRAGIEAPWRADVGRDLSPAEEMAHARRMAEARAARDAELARSREVAADTVAAIWEQAQGADPAHPYLARKGIDTHGARVTGDGRLVVPLYLPDGQLSSLQYIDHAGGKLYHAGAQTGGASWVIGIIDQPGPIYFAEGFATAATIFEATGRPCVVCYSASNLVPVVGQYREWLGAGQELVVVADNDQSGTGQKYADQAAAKHGCRVVLPPVVGQDANDYAQSGGDLNALLAPPSSDWLIPADDFSAQPAPISWLVKRWLQADALIMVHGPSGGGKTFVVLDWCLRMAAGIADWGGEKVRPGPVVYLAGEGHHGLKGRIAAWKHSRQCGRLNMWLSRSGCDLNTPGGYQTAADSIRALPDSPSLIVVDTLHRFLSGDENSAQDAKTMLDACANLMREFRCSALLVHHTGVSEEAQHRARGSSAWRGALDIEISVVPSKNDGPIEVVQRKSKDAELAGSVYVELQSVAIPGWIDEDGEQVTSAVIEFVDAPARAEKVDSKLEKHKRIFEAAWFASGAEVVNEFPYVSRSAFMEYLVSGLGMKESTAKTYAKPGETGRPISALLDAEIIQPEGHGWVVVDNDLYSVLMPRRAAK